MNTNSRIYLPIGSNILPPLVSDLNTFMLVTYPNFPHRLTFLAQKNLAFQIDNQPSITFSFKQLTLNLQATESFSDLQLLEFIQELTERLGTTLRILIQDFVLQNVSEDSCLALTDKSCHLHFEIDSGKDTATMTVSFPARYNKITQTELLVALVGLPNFASIKPKLWLKSNRRGVIVTFRFISPIVK